MNDTPDTPSAADARVQQQVVDALELANFAVSTGAKGNDDHPLSFDDIGTIQRTAALLKVIDIPVEGSGGLTIEQWNAFEQAYYRLALSMTPVTAETLRDTREAGREEGGFWSWLHEKCFGSSPAQRFTRQLWAFAIAFAVFIVLAEWGVNMLGLKKDAASVVGWRTLLQALVPWAYGGLGACAFLLRSAHYFIYARSFDTRRTPEYFNRILLGAISGGAIILFSEYLTSADDGSAAHLGSAALGFIAGYSGDLLFRTVERIVNAIFPKDAEGDASSSSRKPAAANPPPPPPPPPGDQGDDQQGKDGDQPDKNGDKPVTPTTTPATTPTTTPTTTPPQP